MKTIKNITILSVIFLLLTACPSKVYYDLGSGEKIITKEGFLLYFNDLLSSQRLQNANGDPLVAALEESGYLFLDKSCVYDGNKLRKISENAYIVSMEEDEEEVYNKFALKIIEEDRADGGKLIVYALPVKISIKKSTIEETDEEGNVENIEFKSELEGILQLHDSQFTSKFHFGFMLIEFDWEWMEINTNYYSIKTNPGMKLSDNFIQ